jgi:hypothetical protein
MAGQCDADLNFFSPNEKSCRFAGFVNANLPGEQVSEISERDLCLGTGKKPCAGLVTASWCCNIPPVLGAG